MAKVKEHILPFFIPHIGCPNRCVFCDQVQVAGTVLPPTAEEVKTAIDSWQETDLPTVAFYGGSFTALPKNEQIYFLAPAYEALKQNKIKAIRISTRPDAVDTGSLLLLKEYGVKTVEIGVQSVEDHVLKMSGRGHTVEQCFEALKLLKEEGFISGVQLMPGLPGEKRENAMKGIKELLRLKPDMARIYPTIILKNTELAKLYESGLYQPMSVEEAVDMCADIVLLCDYYNVKVIRVGLQPTLDIAWGSSVVAGPFHPAFGHLVKSRIFRQKVLYLLKQNQGKVLYAKKSNIPAIVGQNKENMPLYGDIRIRGWDLPDDVIALGNDKEPLIYLTHKEFVQKALKNCP